MASKIEEKALAKDTMIAKVGEVVVPALYIIRSGKISLSNANVSKELQQGEVFGFGKETLVLTNELKGKNTAFRENGLVGLARNAAACMGEVNLKNNIATSLHNVVVMQDARVGVLTLEAMATILYDVLRLGREGSSLNPSITKDNLEKMRVLGAGTFGQVWLTRETKSNSAYAMKIQFKRELIAYGQAEGVIREKQVMEKMRHPFVMNIVNAQQDSSSLYMILDLIQGGELASQMHSSASGSLDDCSAQFYASCILEGLSYMHRRMFVYRDLKGENVLLDKDGYCVIVDLGFGE